MTRAAALMELLSLPDPEELAGKRTHRWTQAGKPTRFRTIRILAIKYQQHALTGRDNDRLRMVA